MIDMKNGKQLSRGITGLTQKMHRLWIVNIEKAIKNKNCHNLVETSQASSKRKSSKETRGGRSTGSGRKRRWKFKRLVKRLVKRLINR